MRTTVTPPLSPNGPKSDRRSGLALLRRRFLTLDISQQFLLVGGVVLSCAMMIMGTWSEMIVSETALKSTAIASSTFMDLVVEPHVQVMQSTDSLSLAQQDQLDTALAEAPLDNRIVSVKIWNLDGTVVYSTHRDIVGQTFASEDVARAITGEVSVSYDALDETNNEAAFERSTGQHIIEIYAPLHDHATGEVVAVGEYYQNALWFEEQSERSKGLTWLVAGGITLLTLGALFSIVRAASRTIASQRTELRRRVQEAEALARQNDELRQDAEQDRHNAVNANETLLSSLGSELHDGPIQLLSVIALNMSMLRRSITRLGQEGDPALDTERTEVITAEALNHLRNISVGLILPEIENMPLHAVIALAVVRHREVTGAEVVARIEETNIEVSLSIRTCAYRVVQESLNNAHNHARGANVTVTSSFADSTFVIVIEDNGTGMDPSEQPVETRPHLGLNGLRNRVKAVKGRIEFLFQPGKGTKVIVELPAI